MILVIHICEVFTATKFIEHSIRDLIKIYLLLEYKATRIIDPIMLICESVATEFWKKYGVVCFDESYLPSIPFTGIWKFNYVTSYRNCLIIRAMVMLSQINY